MLLTVKNRAPKLRLAWSVCIFLATGCAHSQVLVEPAIEEDYNRPVMRQARLPEGPEVMAKVRQRLADSPVRIEAELKSGGELLLADIELAWGEAPPRARYQTTSPMGMPQETLEIFWKNNEAPICVYSNANIELTKDFQLPQLIEGLSTPWADFSLSFLWWPEASVAGRESNKTRDCLVVDLPRPSWDSSDASRVRLWVDEKEFFVMEAEAYDGEAELIRRLKAKSLKKVDEQWMVKDLEFRNYAKDQKMRVTVREVQPIP